MTLPTSASDTAAQASVYPHADRAAHLPKRTWLVAFLGFLLLCGGWALAAPYDASPDEMQHIIRAVGVARGEIAPTPTDADGGTGAFQHVPASLIRQNCWAFHSDRSAACAESPGGDQHIVNASTRAGRYNPVYYLLVGWPLALWPTWTGILLARLVSSALTAAFLAVAACSAVRWTRHRVMAAGVLAAITPITVHLSGSINPNGLEIAAGAALFAVLIPTVLGSDGPIPRAAAVQIGLAGSVLVTLRALGPLWAVAALGVILVPITRTRLAALAKSRTMRWTIGVIGPAAVVSAVWTVVMRTSELATVWHRQPLTTYQAFRFELMGRLPSYVTEMIGVPSWLDTYLPSHLVVLWQLVIGGLLLIPFAVGTWADRWRMFAIAAGSLLILTVPDALGANKYGFVSQARYVLPLLVGLPILAAWLLGRRGVLDEERGGQLTRMVALVVLPLHLVFLGYTMVRWQSGLDSSAYHMPLNPLAGSWHPVVGSATALATAVLGCGLLGYWVWYITRPADRSADAR